MSETLRAYQANVLRVFGWLALAHVPILIVIAIIRDAHPLEVGLLAALLAGAGMLHLKLGRSLVARGCTLAVALMGQVALLVGIFAGHHWQVEMHFYFFAVLALASALCEMAVLFAAAGAVAVHHLVLNVLLPDLIYPGGADLNRALLHAMFVVIETSLLAAVIAGMRQAFAADQRSRERAEAAMRDTLQARNALQKELDERARGIVELNGAVDGLNRHIADLLGRLMAASQDLSGNAGSLSASARDVKLQMGTAEAAAATVSAHVGEVAHVGDAVLRTIADVGRSTAHSLAQAGRAVAQVEQARKSITGLADMSQQIDEIARLIVSIANSTNMLSLNATIEAARAGAHGQGFAVVAGEVKQLANDTASAAQTIARVVNAIRKAATEAELNMVAVGDMIHSLEESATGIAREVGEQDLAARNMAVALDEAAARLTEMMRAIQTVSGLAERTTQSAAFLHGAADDIAHQAAAIRQELKSFESTVSR